MEQKCLSDLRRLRPYSLRAHVSIYGLLAYMYAKSTDQNPINKDCPSLAQRSRPFKRTAFFTTHLLSWNQKCTQEITNPHVNYQVPFQRTLASLAILIIIVVCISLWVRKREGFFLLSSLIRSQLIHCNCGAAGGIWTASLCLSPVWASLKSGAVIICRCSSWQGSRKQMRTLGGVRRPSHTPLPVIHPYDVGLKWHCNFN